MSHLRAEGLKMSYGGHQVLGGVNATFEPGTVTLIAGRNGAGKSTCLAILAGVMQPKAGRVQLAGCDLTGIRPRARAQQISLVPQDVDASFEFTGREIVMMGRYPHLSRFAAPGVRDHEAVAEALRWTNAEGFADRSVQTLSGGEMRRIHLARSLATQSPVILADEPTASLDLEHAVAILDLLAEFAARGRTVVIASHDLNLAGPRCARCLLLHEGVVFGEGPPEEVLRPEAMETVFGVRAEAAEGFFPRQFRAR